MKRQLSFAVLAALGAFALVVLAGVPLTYQAQAQASPSVAVSLSSTSVEEGNEITVTMSFSGLESDSDTATKDYVFRADVVDSEDGDANGCEDQAGGYGLGVDRYMHQVDQNPETRTGSVSGDCPAGDYAVKAIIASPENVELATARADFLVAAPLSTDATLSGLALSGIVLSFDPATTEYAASVGNGVAETTVAPTVNDEGAAYVVKLDGVVDDDGVVPLAVGGNVVTVEVTAEDGETTKTYTVTVTRAVEEQAGTQTPESKPEPTPAPGLSDATLHKVHVGGAGFSIINPAPGEEASGNIAFDKDNAATVVISSYRTASSVCAWPAQPGASAAIDREDTLPGVTFHESLHFSMGCARPVDFAVHTGSNDVTITVTAPDGVTISRYLITIIVPEGPPGGAEWAEDLVTREYTFMTPAINGERSVGFTLATENDGKFWIAARIDKIRGGREESKSVIALYDRKTGVVDTGPGFTIGPDNRYGRLTTDFQMGWLGNQMIPQLWYDQEKSILWVTAETFDLRVRFSYDIYAFQRTESGWNLLSDKTIRLSHFDHTPEGWNWDSGGMWSDGKTIWVSGHRSYVHAYDIATRRYDKNESFAVPYSRKRTFYSSSSSTPGGIWSDGTTMWVDGVRHREVFAFDLRTKARVPSRDFDLVPARSGPFPPKFLMPRILHNGMWSDGNIIWVRQGAHFVAYPLPGTPPPQFPPQFTSLYSVTLPGDSGDVAELITVRATDADGDPITYAEAGDWPVQFGIGVSSGVISYTRGDGPPIAPGEYRLTVGADDGNGGTADTTVVVTVTPPTGICRRTPQVRDGILAILPGVSDCAAVTDADLSGISGRLDLNVQETGEEMTALQPGDFAGLTNLQILYLIDNSLETLPEDIFEGLAALTTIHLQNNGLKELPEDIFDGLGSLSSLHLANNKLSELPEDVFDGLTEMDGLFLTQNQLSELPEDVFEGLTGLKTLYLDGNELSALSEEVFDGLTSLRELRLNSNSLRELPAGVFALAGLRILELEANDLETLPAGVFEGLTGLEKLYLDGNEGAPFTLTAELERRGGGAVAVQVVEGAPFAMAVKLSAEGGTLSKETVTIEAGSVSSEEISVAPAAEGGTEVTVRVESAEFVGVVVVVDNEGNYSDIQTGLGQPLTLTFSAPDSKDGETIKGPGPTVAIALSPSGLVEPGAAIGVTMSFSGLKSDSDTGTTDYIFRADVVDAENGDADQCEEPANGYGLGVERYMYQVDEDPEVRTGTISAGCPAGDYTLRASVSSPGNVELASASTSFSVRESETPLSTDATLSGLALSGVDFGAFDPDTTGYAAEVGHGVTETTVTPTVNDDGASYLIKLDGVADADRTVSLDVGSNVITVEVMAEDGGTARTYTVTVTRAAPPLSKDATLVNLALSDAPFTFASDTTSYEVNVAHDVDQTTVTATANDDGATYAIKLDGVADADGVIPLAVGSNVITIEVTAEDGETAKTYTVTVTRAAPPLSKDATLVNLALSDAPFTFASDTTSYEVNVAHDVDQTAVTATTNDDGATYAIKLDGVTDADGVIPLAVGSNVITVEVTAEDGNTAKTYTVTVTRAAPPLSNDATLSGLALSGITLSPAFDSATTSYTAGVDNGVTETTVTPTANDDGATYLVKLDGVADADRSVPLAEGSNVITIEVTGADGDTAKTYAVTVTRAAPPPSNDATLSSLTLSGAPFAFDPAIESYEVSVGHEVKQTTITAETNDEAASYEVALVLAGSYEDGTVGLAVGANDIVLVVKAADGETMKTYAVTVTRAEA